MELFTQIIELFILALPIACISWTFTHEDLFKEFVDYCNLCKENTTSLCKGKFFYLFTCEYCFSHYITILMLFITGFKLLFDDWRGYLISGFSLVWIANIYMNLFSYIRVGVKSEKAEIHIKEKVLKK